MVDLLTIRSQHAIDMINQKLASPCCYKFCSKLINKGEEFDTSPFDDYMQDVAQSPVFKTFADSNNNSDCNGIVDQFLLENIVDSPEAEKPFIESVHAFGVGNEIAMETVELYKGTQTDMFADVGHNTKSANKTNGAKSVSHFDLEPTDGVFLVIGKCAKVIRKSNTYLCFLIFLCSTVAAYYRETRHHVIQEMKEDGMAFSPEKLDICFLRMVSSRVSTERLGHSFQKWFLQTFPIFLNADSHSKSKDKKKQPQLEHQYKALLIVYAIALTEVDEKYRNLINFIYLLFPDESMDPVWQCIAIILFGLPECKVRVVM